ncbi:MAG: FmdB family zinc ribbon protein [Chlamydiota bacterium]
MPTYDYTCTKCGHKSEVKQKMTDEPLKKCQLCKENTLRRGPGGGIGISFRGSGFYITDYKNNPSAEQCCPCGKEKASCSGE